MRLSQLFITNVSKVNIMQSSNAEEIVKKLDQISSFLFNLIFIWGIGFFVAGFLCNIFSSNEALAHQLFDLISKAAFIIAVFFFTKIAKILYCFFYCLITKDWSLFKNIEFSSDNANFDHLRYSRELDRKRLDDFNSSSAFHQGNIMNDYAYKDCPNNLYNRLDHYRNY